jgi:hypothetical protein
MRKEFATSAAASVDTDVTNNDEASDDDGYYEDGEDDGRDIL